jgi:GNAT superfamily N-acetyltransferase
MGDADANEIFDSELDNAADSAAWAVAPTVRFGDDEIAPLVERLGRPRSSRFPFDFYALYGTRDSDAGEFVPLVVLLLQISTSRRAYRDANDAWVNPDVRDVRIQRIAARQHKRGHGTRAVLAVAKAAAQMAIPRGVQIQEAITVAGRALGMHLTKEHGFNYDSPPYNFYSALPPG